MTSTVEYKDPSKEQLKIMREFSNICSQAVELTLKCRPDKTLDITSMKIQEAMHWFHSYIINGGGLEKDGSSH